jgi:hypothetical protein
LGLWLTQNCTDANSGPCGSSGANGGYTKRIEECFAGQLTYANNVWDVTAENGKDVDPNATEYTDAHCNNLSDPIWDRIIMFVNDTATIKSMDCLIGSDPSSVQSCTDMGMISGTQ